MNWDRDNLGPGNWDRNLPGTDELPSLDQPLITPVLGAAFGISETDLPTSGEQVYFQNLPQSDYSQHARHMHHSQHPPSDHSHSSQQHPGRQHLGLYPPQTHMGGAPPSVYPGYDSSMRPQQYGPPMHMAPNMPYSNAYAHMQPRYEGGRDLMLGDPTTASHMTHPHMLPRPYPTMSPETTDPYSHPYAQQHPSRYPRQPGQHIEGENNEEGPSYSGMHRHPGGPPPSQHQYHQYQPHPDLHRRPKKNPREMEGMHPELQFEDDVRAKALKRPRLVWTPELHTRFVDAVTHLGIKNSVPKTIMQLMNVDGLTRENVASHLQKYRLYVKKRETGPGGSGAGGTETSGSGGLVDATGEEEEEGISETAAPADAVQQNYMSDVPLIDRPGEL